MTSTAAPPPTVEFAPRLSTDAAEAVARDAWQLDGRATELPSDRDQNFLIDDRAGRLASHGLGPLVARGPADDRAPVPADGAARGSRRTGGGAPSGAERIRPSGTASRHSVGHGPRPRARASAPPGHRRRGAWKRDRPCDGRV